jgi:hypothetical protein
MKIPLAKDFHAKCVCCEKQISFFEEDLDSKANQARLLCGGSTIAILSKGSNFHGYELFLCICDKCISEKISARIILQSGTIEDLLGPLKAD